MSLYLIIGRISSDCATAENANKCYYSWDMTMIYQAVSTILLYLVQSRKMLLSDYQFQYDKDKTIYIWLEEFEYGNMNMYFHFLYFPVILHGQRGCWWPGNEWNQRINSKGADRQYSFQTQGAPSFLGLASSRLVLHLLSFLLCLYVLVCQLMRITISQYAHI